MVYCLLFISFFVSEFIKRIQDRLKSSKQALKQEPDSASKSGKPSHAQGALAISLNRLSPANLTKFTTYLLMLACAVSATYWLMRIMQIPGTPNQPANGISKGMSLYSNQDTSSAYALFGSKPLAIKNIYLRGLSLLQKIPTVL